MESMPSPVVAVTIGDPAGIGPEIVVRALAQDAVRRSVQALVVGDRWVLERAMEVTGATLEFSPAGPVRLLDLANVDQRLQWGKIQATAGAAAGQFIERAVQETLAGRADALAVQDALGQGGQVDGPVPADAVFAQALDGRYDAVLALYHDQGHIAAKTLDFHGAVSVTLALPFIRTSVDHGTAFDIAGKGLARAESMAAAILMAGDLARRTKVGQRAGNA